MINPLEMLKNLENLKGQTAEIKEKLAKMKATGYAMGNQIEVAVTGEMKIESLRIDPVLIKEGNEEMLEVLIASAVNNAFDNIKSRMAEEAGLLGQQFGLGL